MGCGGCRGKGNRHQTGGNGNLKKFAYLTPRQLRKLKEQEESEKDKENK